MALREFLGKQCQGAGIENQGKEWQGMAGRMEDKKLRCSFCNKTQEQVRKLIAGPNGAYICDE